jgi:preprotein translocase subunit SecG
MMVVVVVVVAVVVVVLVLVAGERAGKRNMGAIKKFRKGVRGERAKEKGLLKG